MKEFSTYVVLESMEVNSTNEKGTVKDRHF